MSTNAVVMRTLLGAVLAYSGFDLCKSVLTDKPDNMILFLIFGIIFLIIGLWFMFKALKVAMHKEYEGGKVDIIRYEDKYKDEIQKEKEETEE